MTTIKASEITPPIGKTGGVVYIAREIEQTIDKLLKQGKVVLVTEILPSRFRNFKRIRVSKPEGADDGLSRPQPVPVAALGA